MNLPGRGITDIHSERVSLEQIREVAEEADAAGAILPDASEPGFIGVRNDGKTQKDLKLSG